MRKRILVIVLASVAFPALVLAQVTITNPLDTGTVSELITKIADGVGTVVAGVVIVALLIAAILFVTAAGSEEQYGKAKKALLYAVIGMAIGLGAKALSGIVQAIIGTKPAP